MSTLISPITAINICALSTAKGMILNMNILVADDERIVRVSLISMLNDLNPGIENIYEAANGEYLIKALKSFTPDIAFVDIKMPKLDGLNAIKQGRNLSPHTKWVILTGFSEFEFAKQAIELGVSKYLLKPVSPEDLQDTIATLLKSNLTNYSDLNKKFERDIIAIYNKFDSNKDMEPEGIIKKASFETAVIYFDNNHNESSVKELKKEFFSEMSSTINSFLSGHIRIALFSITNNQVATVCAYDYSRSECKINSYFGRVSELIKKYSSRGLCMTMLKNSERVSYNNLNECFLKINMLSPLRALAGTGYMHNTEKLTVFNNQANYLELSSLFLELNKFYSEKKYLYFNNVLNQLEKLLSQSNFSLSPEIKKNIYLFLGHTINLKLQFEEDIKTCITALRKQGDNLLGELDLNSADYIGQVTDFIKDNYMYNIGISIIADMLNITPNYLSSLFHKKTKMKFIDYLTEVRMLKAKELLAENKLPIAEIAEKVGYLSTRYFTKLFLKHTSQYPSDYRKNLK